MIACSSPAWSSETTNSTPDRPRSRSRSRKSRQARAALAVGQLDRENAAPAIPADADREQHRLAADQPPSRTRSLARVEDQIRAGLGEPLAREPGDRAREERRRAGCHVG